MSEQAHVVTTPLGEEMLLGDSSLAEEADRVATQSREGVLPQDSSQSQQQEITVDLGPHMSIDELLKAIKGANGMPVLFVPSIDGRLKAVAVGSFGNDDNNGYADKNQKVYRSWLLLLTSLIATVTFTAGLNPPGGFWAADNTANGYVAGTSVLRDKFPTRYQFFQLSNKMAFFCSIMIIAMLATNVNNKEAVATLRHRVCFPVYVVVCIASLGASFIVGTWENCKNGIATTCGFLFILTYVSVHWVMSWIISVRRRKRTLESLV
ncbi:hypothetical protein CFC21_090229 [Triticum aestivum]|uniref:PGG domain-containing protein n=2 Tax=Triticum aestivum TaxID=4565 RepID=A0A9R1LDT5_WHEAT|nr:uncharacterized protein LOC123135084 [Triticum aestivum]KAF7087001.1 hypothetical protein CFC21_090229 [Triticum aestivum]